uniref:Ubiquitin-like protease family profile domain-containing protein n=1 Tax=Salix viminalis TaxID=40686 RepID=A0A6N2LE74_SALVM
MDLKVEERALIAFFEYDPDLFCCAVLELVITEEKLDLDLEIEKVFQAHSLALQTYQSRGFEVNPIRLRFFTEWELLTYSIPVSASEIVVQCKNYYLTRGELRSLRPRTWLDDNVLSTMSDAVTLVKKKMKYPVNWYLPISFAVFVPVFDEERNHFFLYVLQLKTQVVEIWDSFAASSQSDWGDRRLHNLLVSLDALFKDDIDQKYQNVWSFKDFRMERPSNVPQQPNGYDCGVYVIKFMVAPEEVTNPVFVFDSDNERLEVALRLLASDVNSCSDDLASKAEAYCEQRFGNCENLS